MWGTAHPHLQPAEKDGTPVEQGTGPNAASYFVCSELGTGPFTRLPEVRPGQIKVARRLKRFLTGRLDSEVRTGTEPNHHNDTLSIHENSPRMRSTIRYQVKSMDSLFIVRLQPFSSCGSPPVDVFHGLLIPTS